MPIVKNTLGLVAFSDFGTLGTNINAPDAFDWRVSIGVGLRLLVAPISAQPLTEITTHAINIGVSYSF